MGNLFFDEPGVKRVVRLVDRVWVDWDVFEYNGVAYLVGGFYRRKSEWQSNFTFTDAILKLTKPTVTTSGNVASEAYFSRLDGRTIGSWNLGRFDQVDSQGNLIVVQETQNVTPASSNTVEHPTTTHIEAVRAAVERLTREQIESYLAAGRRTTTD